MTDVKLSSIVGPKDRPPVSINGRQVTATLGVGDTPSNMSPAGKAELSGALTANEWKTVLDITAGSGVMKLANVWQVNTTARSLGMQVTIDGVLVYSNFFAMAAAANHGINVIGGTFGPRDWVMDRVPFNASLKIEIKSSLTETDMLAYLAVYDLT